MIPLACLAFDPRASPVPASSVLGSHTWFLTSGLGGRPQRLVFSLSTELSLQPLLYLQNISEADCPGVFFFPYVTEQKTRVVTVGCVLP